MEAGRPGYQAQAVCVHVDCVQQWGYSGDVWGGGVCEDGGGGGGGCGGDDHDDDEVGDEANHHNFDDIIHQVRVT